MDEEENAKDGSEHAERESRSCQPGPRHGPRSRDSVGGGDTDQTRLRHVLALPVCPGPAIVPRRSQERASALRQSVAACRRKESSCFFWLRVGAGRTRPGYKETFPYLRRHSVR